MSAYEAVIGLEIHVELSTRSKVFCACPAGFGAEPNTQVCPVCLGLPGSLPVLNQAALEGLLTAALALNCTISGSSKFDRKNYHYPDLVKGYQISQYDRPLAGHGHLEYEIEGETRKAGIRRVHLEEDTGKLIHGRDGTLIDYNRSGVPLMEIVGEPDLRSPAEARAFLEELRLTILYTGVSDVKMEQGSLRCDANISVRPAGTEDLGVLTEIKNMNSFRSVERALEHELGRQAEILASGGHIVRETRHWDEDRGVTTSSRSKEEAHDYRYFPEPDLPPMTIGPELVRTMRARVPELPQARRRRLMEMGLPAYDARVLTEVRELGEFFDRCVGLHDGGKTLSNWIMTEVQGYLNTRGVSLASTALEPGHLVELLALVDKGRLSGTMAKDLLPKVMDSGKSPAALAEELGFEQVTDEGQIAGMVERVLAGNQDTVADYLGGKEKAIGFLVGQVMKLSRGQANPGLVQDALRSRLEALREGGDPAPC